eukprot:g18760.t1
MLRQLHPQLSAEMAEGGSLLILTESMQLYPSLILQTGLGLVNSFSCSGTHCSALIWAELGEARHARLGEPGGDWRSSRAEDVTSENGEKLTGIAPSLFRLSYGYCF